MPEPTPQPDTEQSPRPAATRTIARATSVVFVEYVEFSSDVVGRQTRREE